VRLPDAQTVFNSLTELLFGITSGLLYDVSTCVKSCRLLPVRGFTFLAEPFCVVHTKAATSLSGQAKHLPPSFTERQ